MSITDELREFADELDNKAALKSEHGFSPVGMRLERIADSIDAEHEREVDEARMDAFAMPNHRVALPMDADGVPIDLGDEVYYIDNATEMHETHFTVTFFTLYKGGWEVNNYKPSRLRHWDKSTVEELLLDFSDKVLDSGHQWGLDAEETIAEYAERIREAMEHE
jgi:hypothetical protein